MKKILQFSFLVLFIVGFSSTDTFAQRKSGKKKDVDEYFDESGGFKHRLWYGAGGSLGFTGNNFQSTLNIGFAPMVGYKITENFSVGPRVSLNYYRVRSNVGSSIQKDNYAFYTLGAFSRYKVLNTFFAHVEYEYNGYPDRAVIDYDNNGGCQQVGFLRSESKYYGGIGYNSGGGTLGYEIYALYQFNANDCIVDFPITIRAGLTYKF